MHIHRKCPVTYKALKSTIVKYLGHSLDKSGRKLWNNNQPHEKKEFKPKYTFRPSLCMSEKETHDSSGKKKSISCHSSD